MFGWCSRDHKWSWFSRAFLEAEWCWVLPPQNKQTTKTLFLLLNSVNDFLSPGQFCISDSKISSIWGLFVFDFWDSKHLLALSKAVHEIDSSQRDHSLINNQYLGHSKSLCFMGRGPLVREMGQKGKRMVFTQTSTLFFVPPLQIHRTNPSKSRIYSTLFFAFYQINWASSKCGDENWWWWGIILEKAYVAHDSLAHTTSSTSWWSCVTPHFTRGYYNKISWSHIMTISIGRAESLGKGVFILLGKETRIRVPHHFSPAFFFLPITEAILEKSGGNRWKRRAGKEWCSGRRKRRKQWKNKSWLV